MSLIALVPMKGHSERIPNKNMKMFSNRPLFHAVMDTLSNSRFIQRIVINTDSHVIADNAKKHYDRVDIIWRPENIQGDFVSMNKIIEYDTQHYSNEYFLQTHSTNPLLSVQTVDRAIDDYYSSLDTYDSLFSVNRLQTRLYWDDLKPVNHSLEELKRTQDLPPVFEENSNIYIFSKASFRTAGNNRIGKKPKMFEMNQMESIDIDEQQDFELAELIYQKRQNLQK